MWAWIFSRFAERRVFDTINAWVAGKQATLVQYVVVEAVAEIDTRFAVCRAPFQNSVRMQKMAASHAQAANAGLIEIIQKVSAILKRLHQVLLLAWYSRIISKMWKHIQLEQPLHKQIYLFGDFIISNQFPDISENLML